MTLIEALILGVIQGLTEFLPVSSSGHLVLAQILFGLKDNMLAFDVAVHWATLAAVFVYFRKDFLEMFLQRNLKIMGLIFAASVPTAVIGILFKDYFESLFSSLPATGIGWIVTALFLLYTARIKPGAKAEAAISVTDALWIGVAQGISIIPSVSRSGATIFAALLLGIDRKAAVRFSFWIAVPAILGAGLLEMKEGIEWMRQSPAAFWTGFLSSGILGYLTIAWLLNWVSRGKFYLFGWYCLGIGIFTLLLSAGIMR